VGGKKFSVCIVFMVEVAWGLIILMVYLMDMSVDVNKASVL
jgi:hypothetical protein